MKHLLLTTIAAVLVVGCGAKLNYSGVYTLDIDSLGTLLLELKPDSSFIGTPQGEEDDRGIGSWKVEGDLLVCEGTTEKSSKKIVLKLNKTTLELTSLTVDGEDRRPPVPEGADGHYFKQSAPSPETTPVEPVAEAAKPEPPTAKAPDISIHIAAEEGNINAIKKHLAAGTNLNARNKGGFTPLQIAAGEGQKEIAELLIAKGANVNAKSDDGLTALLAANLGPHKEVAKLLITKGADVNARGFFGMTPLHAAAMEGNKEIAELLIAAGADLNAKAESGETPLELAIDLKQTKIADLLRKHGADLKQTKYDDLLRKLGGKTKKGLKAEGK